MSIYERRYRGSLRALTHDWEAFAAIGVEKQKEGLTRAAGELRRVGAHRVAVKFAGLGPLLDVTESWLSRGEAL